MVAACSTAPVKPVTMNDLSALKLNKYFKVDNSLEEILGHINKEGEVIIEAVSKKRRGVKAKPYYIKIMATSTGLQTRMFPRELAD
jgi:hypothetical protein